MESSTARPLPVLPSASAAAQPPLARPATIHPLTALSAVPTAAPAADASSASAGRVLLDSERLRELRRGLLLSQEELATQCWQRRLRVSIATLKRAETGRPVLFRTARALASFFDVPVRSLLA